jgi:UDP-N-acetylmuramyl tripeptide synthase
MRFKSALISAKLANKAAGIIDRSRGTNLAGTIGMKIDPKMLSHFKGIDPDKVLFITGTNGKSTTNNMINHLLRSQGYKVVSNIEGANLITGVATALIRAADMNGRVDADFYIFETDERYLHSIREQLPCSNLLVTNLQKDQVQRNGDPSYISRKIQKVIDDFEMNLFLNADEPRSHAFADKGRRTVLYGVEKNSMSFTKDDTFVTMPCPKCRHRIVFDVYNNDGLGEYHCENCGYGTGEADYKVADVDFEEGSFRIHDAEFSMHHKLPYMLYNYASAVAVAGELAGITPEDSAIALKDFTNVGGRVDSIDYNGQHINYMRFKQENPETLQNFINMIADDQSEKVVVIGFGTVNDFDPHYINSFYAYDCDYSGLIDSNVIKYIFVTDTIAYDAAISFIYGGVDPDKVEVLPTSNEEEILEAITSTGCDNVYLTIELHRFERMKAFAEKSAAENGGVK